jgi:DNA-binding LacI/PurR family transcriptional regulator
MPGASIGFVPPWWATSIHAWYTATVFDGVCNWSERRELQQSVLRVGRSGEDPHLLLEKIQTRGLKGIIWVHPVPDQLELLQAISCHVPCVVVGRDYQHAGLHTVLPSYRNAAIMIDRHLAANGHETYAVLSRSLDDPLAATWLDGFKGAHALRGARLDVAQNVVDVGPYDRSRMAELLLDFYLPQHEQVTAMVATTSSYLVPLLSSEKFRSRVPEHLSLIAFDYGIQPMHTYWPGWTISHVACDWTAIGQRAADTLCSLIDGQDAPRVQYQPVNLVEGQTVRKRKSDSMTHLGRGRAP